MEIKMYKNTGTFFILSTLVPWLLWGVAAFISHNSVNDIEVSSSASIIAFLGLIAPVFIAFYLARKQDNLTRDMLSRFGDFKSIKLKYVFFTCFFMLASILLAQLISTFYGYSFDQFRLIEHFSFSSGVFPVWFMLIAAPALEEMAWHSYGTDSLRNRFNLFNTSIIFALFWGAWHLPLSFIKDYYHSNVVESGWLYSANFLLSLFPFVIIMNWLYYKTHRNILITVIFHISAGFFNEIFLTHPMSKVIQTVLLTAFAALLIIRDKDFFFKRSFNTINENIGGTNIAIGTDDMNKAKTRNANRFIQKAVVILLLLGFGFNMNSQTITQTVRGKVYDEITKESLPFVTVVLVGTDPIIGTATDENGEFVLNDVPVGRQDFEIKMLGYETYLIKEMMITSGNETVLEIGMGQSKTELEEVVVRVNKESTLNSMTTLSGRQFTVEEGQRYAGGLDDPARLVSSFAGVANPSISSNGISVRGNSPGGLLWRIEGIEVPTPIHFANLEVAGGGLLTGISSQMMANSDFYTGAFPAEYGNASSGVFDIKLKKGNDSKRQYAFQAGVLGVDFATQGPFVKGKKASYIMNYRYSTMALVIPLLPDDAGVLKYQDLSFKTYFPTKKAGTFSLWGIGMIDGVNMAAADSSEWESNFDRDDSQTKMHMYAAGLTHKLIINESSFLSTTFSATGSGLEHKEQRLDYDLMRHPQSKAQNGMWRYSAQSVLNKRFGKSHTNKTGINFSHMGYDIDVEQSLAEGELPTQIANKRGDASLLQAFTQSQIKLGNKLTLNTGVNAQYFLLNKNLSIEPRIGLKYQINKNNNIALAYGLHSRIEQLPVYFVSSNDISTNKKLDFMKSAHYVFAYNTKLGENTRLSIEPYYQQLSQVPVGADSYISTLNIDNSLFFNEQLVSKGTGHNMGVDVTLEQFLHKGFYYMLTASVFDSKYKSGDGIERNTRFNKNYVFNFLVGKEWSFRKNNMLSVNLKVSYAGGNRIEPINITESLQHQNINYGETGEELAFEKRFNDLPIISFGISYRKISEKWSSVWSLQVLNASATEEFSKDFYNFKTLQVDTKYDGIPVPNLSYKIEF